MKGNRPTFAWALALLSVASFAQKRTDPLQAELDKLTLDYSQALNNYYKPYDEAKDDQERAKIKLDSAKDPNRTFLSKAVSLAEKCKKRPAVFAKAGTFALRLAMSANDRKATDRLLAELETVAIDQTEFGHSLYLLDQYGWQFLGNDRAGAEKWALTHCDKIIAKTKNREVKAAALMHKAEVFAPPYGEAKDLAKGREIYVTLRDKFSDTSSGKRAANEIFRVDNLQVGMVAPEILATDENGKAFKLSEYRGQVVVLDFWGFW